MFELRLPIPFEDGLINVFLFADGSDVDMIDCGINDQRSFELIEEAVIGLGGSEARVRKLLVTHAHRDHFGGVGALRARYGCDVLVHRFESRVIADHYVAPEAARDELVRHLRRNGLPDPLIERALREGEAIAASVDAEPPTVELDGGETVRLGTRDVELIWTPGHSPGHLCALDRELGTLFCGDLALPEITPNIGLHPQSTPSPMDDFTASLRHVVELAPTLVHPSHGRPYTDVAGRAEELIAHHLRRCDDVTRRIADRPGTAWELASSIWSEQERARPYHNQLALQEALAHLQSLALRGVVVKELGDETTTWSAADRVAPEARSA